MMESIYASRINIRKILREFDPKETKFNHRDYLEGQLNNLEKMVISYRVQSQNKELSPRIRARSRDLEQNAMGLLNGIKFALSFLDHQDKEDIE